MRTSPSLELNIDEWVGSFHSTGYLFWRSHAEVFTIMCFGWYRPVLRPSYPFGLSAGSAAGRSRWAVAIFLEMPSDTVFLGSLKFDGCPLTLRTVLLSVSRWAPRRHWLLMCLPVRWTVATFQCIGFFERKTVGKFPMTTFFIKEESLFTRTKWRGHDTYVYDVHSRWNYGELIPMHF